MRRLILVTLLLQACAGEPATQPDPPQPEGKRPLRPDDLFQMMEVTQVSMRADGRFTAYTLRTFDVKGDRYVQQIWMKETSPANPVQLTDHEKGASSPAWSPDGTRLAFVMGGQIWTMDETGGDRRKITNAERNASKPVWSPDGSRIAYLSREFPNGIEPDPDPDPRIHTEPTYLGSDEGIKVERERVSRREETGALRKIHYHYEIKVENYKDEKVTVTVLDQIPVAQDNDVEVMLEDGTTEATVTHKNGKMEWKVELEAKGKKTITLKYHVYFPAHKPVHGLDQ